MLKLPLFFGVLSLALSGAFLVFAFESNRNYFDSTERNMYPDAVDYGLLAKNILENRTFSRTTDLHPDPLRTPGYPLLLCLFRSDISPVWTYIAQIVMLAGTVFFVVKMTKEAFGECAAVIAGSLMVTDHSLYCLALQTMAEIAGLFFFLCGLGIAKWPCHKLSDSSFKRLAVSAFFLSYAVLIRPSFLMIPFALIFVDTAASWWSRKNIFTMHFGIRTIVFLLLFSVMPIGWVARNYTLFGLPQLTTVSTHNLVYFVGAGAIQYREKVDRYEAQARIADRYDLPPYSMAQTPIQKNASTVSEIERSLQEKKWRIVFHDPQSLLCAELIGIAKGSISHAMEDTCILIGQQWSPPGFFGLVKFDSSAYRSLFMNSPFALFVFSLYLANLSFLYSGVFLFFLFIFRNITSTTVVMNIGCILICGYLTIALFGMDAVYRSRLVVLPILCMISGAGFARFFSQFTSHVDKK
ncbi:MAG: hypothetical protein NTY15_21240 [Planctomycetota bacterium]|nr:hypothetical protein [Planctomycetota bacterium]